MSDYAEQLKNTLERRKFLLANMEEHKNFTSYFIKNVSDELIRLENNISKLDLLAEIEDLKVKNVKLIEFINDEDNHTEGELGDSCIAVENLLHFIK